MAFNPKAQTAPYISIEVAEPEQESSPKQRVKDSVKDSVSKPSFADQEFSHQAELMRNDITSFVAEGRDIRNEVEQLISWRRHMGEASGSPNWGPVQKSCAEHSIQTQRARLAKLKSSIEAKRPDAQEIIEYIFGENNIGRYPAEITKQVREELGL
jgi:hypothetical protein